MRRGAPEQRLRRFLVEHARVDAAVVQFTEGEERRERDAAIAAAERTVGEQREDERCHFFGERRVSLPAEGRDLRALHGVDQTELRLDDAGMRGGAAELRADRAMQLNQILDGEISDAAVSR